MYVASQNNNNNLNYFSIQKVTVLITMHSYA